MSLKIWLPLNGSLKNQGVNPTVFTNLSASNTTSSTNGKVTSNCYYNDSFTVGGLRSNNPVLLGSNQSMFCWFKITTLTSSSNLGGGLVSQHRYGSNSGMGITIKYVSSTTGYLSINTGNGSSRTYNTYCGTTLLQANVWYHGGYTYDGSTIKIYLNGVCENTISYSGMSVPSDYLTVFCWSMNGTSGSDVYWNYKFNGRINDVRVYDHCLSLKEVKNLAKGLMLHYPLSRPQDNLVTSSYIGKSAQWTVGDTTYGKLSRSVSADGKQNSTTYTISAKVKTTGNRNIAMYYNDTGWVGGKAWNTGWQTTNGEWKVISKTFTTASDQSSYTVVTAMYSQTDKTNGEVFVEWFKLEKGNKATPWIPNMTDTMSKNMPINSVSPSGYLVNASAVNVGSASSSTQWMFATFTPIGGGNFQPRIHRVRFKVTVLAGSVSTVTVLFYNLSTSTGNTRIDAPIVNGYVDIFITPSSAIPNLLIYAGVAGATANKHILIENVLVYDQFNVSDTSGYNNNGSAINIKDVNSDTARYLASYPFNGSNSYIRCLDPIKSSATEFTISFWVYLNNISTTMCLWNGRTTAGASVALFIVNSNMYFDDSTRTTVTTELTANNWIHIVGTWKSGGKKILYVNGISKSSVNAGTLSKSNNYATIGLSSASDATPSGNPFNGKISDVRIYATALSADDVKELYNVGASIDKNGNMHCYELVEV